MAPNNENQNEPQYETHDYAGDRATDTYQVMQHIPFIGNTSRADLQDSITNSQATELQSEVRMGDDRVISDTPNWHGHTSEQLYNFATQDNSPTTADSLGRGFTDGGNRLAEAANALFEAVSALEGAWSGAAADSARGALAPLATAAGNTGQTAQMMGVQMSRQSVAATEVRKLPPPQDFDQQQALQAMVTGGPAAMQADLKAQQEAANAVKREQITYLDAYTQTMTSVDEQTPSFVPPPERGIDPGAGGGPRITGSAVPVPSSGGFTGGTSPGGPAGGWVGAAPGAASGSALVPGSEEGGLDTSGLALPGTVPGTGAAGYTPGTAPATTPGVAPGGMPPGVGGGSTSVPAAGAGGFGGSFGNFGAGGAGATGAGGLGAGGTGQGASTGAGPRGGVPGSGMGPGGGGVTGRGAGGTGGMGGGGRRANGEDDDEHERPSYLLEGDPDSAFGSDQMAAPSVIGDDNGDG